MNRWRFVYRDSWLLSSVIEATIPKDFEDSELLIQARSKSSERALGDLIQVVFIPGFGKVRGDSFRLYEGFQRLHFNSEFPYRLTFSPFRRIETLDIAVWLGMTSQESWQSFTFVSPWRNTGGGYVPGSFFKDTLGMVHVRGQIVGGGSGSTITVLPVGYRPSDNCYFVVYGSGLVGVIEIQTDGLIKCWNINNVSIGLGTIIFRAEK